MGYKSKQHLTTKGYQLSHKRSTSTRFSDELQLDDYYKKFIENLRSKYTRKNSIVNTIRTIMSRPEKVANISSRQNRQLTLIDIDKMLSIKTGSLKTDGARIKAMRRAAMRIHFEGRDSLLQTPRITRIDDVLNFELETQILQGMDNQRNNRREAPFQRIQRRQDQTDMFLNFDRFQTYRPLTFAAQPINQIEPALMMPQQWRPDPTVYQMRVPQINNPFEQQILPFRRQMRGDRY